MEHVCSIVNVKVIIMSKERTFVMIKPDAVQRGLIGEIIRRFEQKGIKIVAMKMVSVDKDLAEKHYGVHKGKSFFEPTVKYITSSPVEIRYCYVVCDEPAWLLYCVPDAWEYSCAIDE